jgi:serine/threonine-protein kinase
MSAEQARRICEACERFEWERIQGKSPRIESYLHASPDEDRPQLLEDLLGIELQWRRSSGERPVPDDYTCRFPDQNDLIEQILGEQVDLVEPTRIVGRYELHEEIGRGREGVVYRARETWFASNEVAVKLLGAGMLRSREDERRFVQSIRYLAGLYHPHIVPYHDSGEDRGQLYCVMRLLHGGSLAERPMPMDPLDATTLLIKITEAVHYLHSQPLPVVHRDLKPKNILFDEAGNPYVADFGLAFLHDGRSVAGGACGTLPYIAPEQFDDRFGELGPASDLYSLGVILYELLVGQPPFPRNRESILLTLEREPIPPSRLRSGIPGDLERICLRCLSKSTGERYQSAEELLIDLRCVERGDTIPSPPEGFLSRLVHKARREPALAVRVVVIVACSAIMWGYRLAVGQFAPLLPNHWATKIEESGVFPSFISTEAILVWLNQVIFIAWGLASWAFQRQLNRKQDQGGLQLGWRLVDVVVFAVLIELDDALMSPLTVAFAVLIVTSAFWARADQILQTTLLSMTAYILLTLTYRYFHGVEADRPWRHFHYLVGLAAIGLMLTYQANRTRALARISVNRL